jgi:hypothetical protein
MERAAGAPTERRRSWSFTGETLQPLRDAVLRSRSRNDRIEGGARVSFSPSAAVSRVGGEKRTREGKFVDLIASPHERSTKCSL